MTPFGDSVNLAGAFAQRLMFPGQYADVETSDPVNGDTVTLSHNWHRTYDPTLGRYLQSDPIGLAGGLNRFAYVGGNPMSYIDPTGLVTAVIYGHPTSSNPFGHVAIATTGHGVTSFGTNTPSGSSLIDYLRQQTKYRETTVYLINSSAKEEAKIREYLDQFSTVSLPPVPSFDSSDTCASRTNGALAAAGYVDARNPYATLLSATGIQHSPLPETSSFNGAFYSKGLSHNIPQGTQNIPRIMELFNP